MNRELEAVEPKRYDLKDKEFDFEALTPADFEGNMLYAELYELDDFQRELAKRKLSARAKKLGYNFSTLWKIKKLEMDGQWNIGANSLPIFTIEALESELPALNISPVYDDIAATIRFGTPDRNERATVPTVIYSALCGEYRGVNLRILTAYLTNIALKNHVNPVIDYLNSVENMWDGVDRMPELYRILGIDTDSLSQTLVLKWFWQGYSLLLNGRWNAETFGADGILVLTGAQGIGKTSFFRWAAIKGEWFKDGCTLSKDKDEERRIVTSWIAELGEIGRTLRGDLDSLKAFVTRDLDRYRLPYAATDTENPRHTNLCGTVNGEDGFLIDPTGNRRFWTVPVDNIDLPALKELDAVQIWAQIAMQHALKNRQGFRLTREERDELEKRNGSKHMKKTKCYDEVIDLVENAGSWMLTTVTDWKDDNPCLRSYSVNAIGAALKQCAERRQELSGKADPKSHKAGRKLWLPVAPYNQHRPVTASRQGGRLEDVDDDIL